MMIKSLGVLQHLCQAPLMPRRSLKASLIHQQSPIVNAAEKAKRTQSERWRWTPPPRLSPARETRRVPRDRLSRKRERRCLQVGESQRPKRRPEGPKVRNFCFTFIYKSQYCFLSTIITPIPLHHSYSRQSHVNRSAAVETHSGTTCIHDLLRMSPGWALGQGLSNYTTRCKSRTTYNYDFENKH